MLHNYFVFSIDSNGIEHYIGRCPSLDNVIKLIRNESKYQCVSQCKIYSSDSFNIATFIDGKVFIN